MKYRHKKLIGCDIELLRKEYIGQNILKIYYCKTHEVETCRCGAEWGKH